MYFTNLNLPVEGGVIKPGLDVVVGCTYFMALITLSLFFGRRVGGGVCRREKVVALKRKGFNPSCHMGYFCVHLENFV